MFDEIIGKTIVNLEFPDEETLIFNTTAGRYRYRAEGDCCSQSWIESISDNTYSVTNATVSDINIKSNTFPGTRQESDTADFVTLVTDKGHFDIEFRNSSNGYYGGWMELVESPEEIGYQGKYQ